MNTSYLVTSGLVSLALTACLAADRSGEEERSFRLSAVEIGYDKQASGLAGEDVQDALDELAARDLALEDAATRVSVESVSFVLPVGGDTHFETLLCNAGSVVLSGNCESGLIEGVAVARDKSFVIDDRNRPIGFKCGWKYSSNVTIDVSVQVVCMREAL